MSKAIYRPLFLEAWRTVWLRRRLWLFGLFAMIMASGGLFESLSGSWQTAQKGRMMLEQCLNGTLPGYQWLVSLARYTAMLPTAHQYILAAATLFFLAVLVTIGVLAQGTLFVGLAEKHPSNFKQLLKSGRHFFWRILGVDLLGKIGLGLVFLFTAVPAALLNPLPYGWHKYPPFIALIIFLAGVIFITVIQMLALAGVVKKHLNAWAAVVEAWHIFRLHVLVSFELGILLFVTSLAAVLGLLAILAVLTPPTILLFVVAALFNSVILYNLFAIISAGIVAALLLLTSGFLNTFQYAVWSLYFERAEQFGIIPKIKRWLKIGRPVLY